MMVNLSILKWSTKVRTHTKPIYTVNHAVYYLRTCTGTLKTLPAFRFDVLHVAKWKWVQLNFHRIPEVCLAPRIDANVRQACRTEGKMSLTVRLASKRCFITSSFS